ncbi:winged helix-turn-helix transcriptional regulator [Rubricoccus marinus]|uniref:Transcriptional regulator n=1 Tax=Rubricoccus marinus TaxID=716817 RepID=A0A259TV03_9BACT|nr:helix-turn-helix domain-containing protein [Rubricoccus marinus]OZC01561.1 transcriptional regulator [Rubricoccus marinus]
MPDTVFISGALSDAVQRGDVLSADCPSRPVLRRVTNRWGVVVLLALASGTHRFSELRRKANGISERMLAKTLQDLESDGFVDRVAYPVVPPHVEYSLTPLGQELLPHVAGLADWVESNIGRILAAQAESE